MGLPVRNMYLRPVGNTLMLSLGLILIKFVIEAKMSGSSLASISKKKKKIVNNSNVILYIEYLQYLLVKGNDTRNEVNIIDQQRIS